MKRRTRYLFISLCVVFFLVAAPLTIFYVGGIKYNSKGNNYSQTGILSVVTDPKKATIKLDGAVTDTSPANFRFLQPKEYQVTLSKDGYWDWSKRLQVKAGLATIASGALDKIYLLKKTDGPVTISNNVIDYTVHGNTLVYLTTNSINKIVGSDYNQVQTMSLSTEEHSITSSPQGNYVLLQGNNGRSILVDVNAWQATDISDKLGQLSSITVTDSGMILGLRGATTLVRFDPQANTTTSLVSNISIYKMLDQNLYFVQTKNNHSLIAVAPLANPTGVRTLLDNLPDSFNNGQLLITNQKDVFIFTGSELYKVNTTLDKISDSIQQLNFNPDVPALQYTANNELYWYEFSANKSHLVTRSTTPIQTPQVALNIGYAFYVQDNNIEAIELDSTDRQNTYTLYSGVAGSGSIQLDSATKNLYVLDQHGLQILNIR